MKYRHKEKEEAIMGNVMGENTDDEIILETKRLVLRRLRRSDYGALCLMLKDEEVMYAYEHAFEDWEAADWLDRQLMRYETYGFGLWAVVLKETGEVIGQCGLTMQEVGDSEVLEVGYLLRKEFWHHGYALEAAAACRDYAFEKLGAEAVYSIIRENNGPSRAVAERNGMTVCGSIIKHYYGLDMPHLLYRISRVE